MTIKLTRWDAAEHLNTNEQMGSFLAIALEEPDPVLTRAVMDDIARAMGIREISKQTGIELKELKRAFLTDDVPDSKTVAKLIRALNPKSTALPRKTKIDKTVVGASRNMKRAKSKAS